MAKQEALFVENGQVWSTDGTLAGTGAIFQVPRNQFEVYGFTGLANGTAVFATYDGSYYRLYDTDGTAAGTTVIDTTAAPTFIVQASRSAASASPGELTPLNGAEILFDAGTGSTNFVLQSTDGTASGTQVLANVAAGPVIPLGNGQAVFDGNNQLWVTDGTPAGTAPVPGNIQISGNPSFTAIGGGKALFTGLSGGRTELFQTDGTASGTAPLYTGFSFTANQFGFSVIGGQTVIGNFTPLGNGTTLFEADDGQHGPELWATDGTTAGTRLVKDIDPGPAGSFPQDFALVGNGRAVFVAQDGTGSSGLWTTDGTMGGTSLVTELPSSNVQAFTSLGNGKVVFQLNNNSGVQLWATDGAAAGTGQITTIPTGGPIGAADTDLQDFSALPNGGAVFLVNTTSGGTSISTVWTTDGTAAGTMPLTGASSQSNGETFQIPSLSQPVTVRGTYGLPVPIAGVSTAAIATIDVATTLGGTGALQIQPGTQAIQFLDATLGTGPASNEAFLARVFAGLFNAPQNAAAIGTADDLLASGVTQAQVAADLLATPQGVTQYGSLSDAQFATAVFQGLVGRAPSAVDVAGLTNLLAAGTTRGAVAAGLADSAEAQGRFNTSHVLSRSPDTSLAYNLFQTAVGTEPTVASEQGVLSELRTAGVNALQVAEQFAGTAQFQSLHAGQSDGTYVASIYTAGWAACRPPSNWPSMSTCSGRAVSTGRVCCCRSHRHRRRRRT